MTTTANRAAFERAIDAWNAGSLARYLDLYDANVLLHGFPPGLPPGREGAQAFYAGIWAAFPGSQLVIHQLVEQDDFLACRYSLHVTHTGEFMGVPPTGRSIEVDGQTMLRFAGGRCVERWNQADMLGWLQQLGAIPMPG